MCVIIFFPPIIEIFRKTSWMAWKLCKRIVACFVKISVTFFFFFANKSLKHMTTFHLMYRQKCSTFLFFLCFVCFRYNYLHAILNIDIISVQPFCPILCRAEIISSDGIRAKKMMISVSFLQKHNKGMIEDLYSLYVPFSRRISYLYNNYETVCAFVTQ